MSGETVLEPRQLECGEAIAAALRAQWRLFDRVTVDAVAGGEGFYASIYLDQTIVRGAAEQQGTKHSPRLRSQFVERRAKAISECVERTNADLPPAKRICGYRVIE